jgi:hypothetical protein
MQWWFSRGVFTVFVAQAAKPASEKHRTNRQEQAKLKPGKGQAGQIETGTGTMDRNKIMI